MEPLLPVQVTDDLRIAVEALVGRITDRLAAHHGDDVTVEATAAPGWEPFAAALGLDVRNGVGPPASHRTSAEVVVGPIEATIEALDRHAEAATIGFVAPAAFRRHRWQRGGTRFLDPTKALWQADWSPLAVERIDVAGHDATIEVVVGHARATPTSLIGRSWL